MLVKGDDIRTRISSLKESLVEYGKWSQLPSNSWAGFTYIYPRSRAVSQCLNVFDVR